MDTRYDVDDLIRAAGTQTRLKRDLGFTSTNFIKDWRKNGIPKGDLRGELKRLYGKQLSGGSRAAPAPAVSVEPAPTAPIALAEPTEPVPAAPAAPVAPAASTSVAPTPAVPALEPTDGPTERIVAAFRTAYDHFNTTLFEGRLPRLPSFTLQRKARTGGYYAPKRIGTRSLDEIEDELALNPSLFKASTDEHILSILVHEMCHLEQYRLHEDTITRDGYHNQVWGQLMRRVGLIPSATGQPGGRPTGQRMHHYVEPGGRFEQACAALLATGFTVPYIDLWDPETRTRKAETKTKFSCPSCKRNVWGMRDTQVDCRPCKQPMVAGRREA